MAFYITYYAPYEAPIINDVGEAEAAYRKTCGKRITICKNSAWHTQGLQKDLLLPYKGLLYNVVSSTEFGELTELLPAAKEYTTFRIPKKSGGYREIKAPNPTLKEAQRTLLKIFQKQGKILEHNCAYGFINKRNCKRSLQVHQDNHSNWFLKVDFHNFFPSFDQDTLRKHLNQIPMWYDTHPALKNLLLALITDETDRLCQGAPTSPFIANIAMMAFDYEMDKYCKHYKMIYTRYADDILISSKFSFKFSDVVDMIVSLLHGLNYPLTLSEHKTRYGSCSGRNWNLGLMYNQEHNITVGYRKKHLLKVIAHKWDELSDVDKAHWKGVYSYCASIEPEYFQKDYFKCMLEYK